jgi:hypothetical protein
MRRFTVRRFIIVLLLFLGAATALALVFPTRLDLFWKSTPTDRVYVEIVVWDRHAELWLVSASDPSVAADLERRSPLAADYPHPECEDDFVYGPVPPKLRSFWCEWSTGGSSRYLDQKTGEYRMFPRNWLNIRTHLWLPLVLLLIYPAIAFIRGPVRRWHRRRNNRCVACGYDLMGNVTGICPECATAVPRVEKAPG